MCRIRPDAGLKCLRKQGESWFGLLISLRMPQDVVIEGARLTYGQREKVTVQRGNAQ